MMKIPFSADKIWVFFGLVSMEVECERNPYRSYSCNKPRRIMCSMWGCIAGVGPARVEDIAKRRNGHPENFTQIEKRDH
jgi:hypothetical protein